MIILIVRASKVVSTKNILGSFVCSRLGSNFISMRNLALGPKPKNNMFIGN